LVAGATTCSSGSARPSGQSRPIRLLACISASAPTRKSVEAFHAAALKLGGKDNGEPGQRNAYGDNYYAAFVIDPDGYRLEAYCGATQEALA
jgi:predicted lactoylglutathione lyase